MLLRRITRPVGRVVYMLVCLFGMLLVGSLPIRAERPDHPAQASIQSAAPANLTLLTQPRGLQLRLDSQVYTDGASVLVDPGKVRVLRAVLPQSRGGKTFTFNTWSIAGCAAQPFITPANPKTITAYYRVTSAPPSKVGVYRPSRSTFLLRNTNTTGVADFSIVFGSSSDLPLAGDWNGDGIDTVGVFRPSTGQFFLRNSNAASAPLAFSLTLGGPGDLPIAGDWDGDGRDGIGVFRPSAGRFQLRNTLTTGLPDIQVAFGGSGDLPVAGDWNADGLDSPGIYRSSNATFLLTDSVCNCGPSANYAVTFGTNGDRPLAGDWNGDGTTGIGIYRASTGQMLLRNNPRVGGPPDIGLTLGANGDLPLSGSWSGTGSSPTAPEFAPNTSLIPSEGPDC